MRVILDVIRELLSEMSVSAFLVSIGGLVLSEIILYLVGRKVKNNQNIKKIQH